MGAAGEEGTETVIPADFNGYAVRRYRCDEPSPFSRLDAGEIVSLHETPEAVAEAVAKTRSSAGEGICVGALTVVHGKLRHWPKGGDELRRYLRTEIEIGRRSE